MDYDGWLSVSEIVFSLRLLRLAAGFWIDGLLRLGLELRNGCLLRLLRLAARFWIDGL